MAYDHTQRGRFHLLLVFLGLVLVLVGSLLPEGGAEAGETVTPWWLAGVGALFLGISQLFARLRVRDLGTHLGVRFGPVPWVGRRVPYEGIRGIRVGRSSLVDGWGIHWRPGRGWIWNLWGFECVELQLEAGARLRIGTDDPAGLAAFLADRTGIPPG